MIKLAIYIHNHQPVGNFEEIFEYAYTHSYKPLLEGLLKHSNIKFGMHNSGPLCDWLERKHPEYFDMLKQAVTNKQAEILSSAYSEPILSLIPKKDLADQIRYFSDYLYKKFDYAPKGLWLTERVWEPGLIQILRDSGIEYTLLDDTHFRYAGLHDEELSSYFITEEEGQVLKVFPISMKLRYLIPFHQVHETIDFLKEEEKNHPGSLKCLGDDGEKFGVWPGTHQWVFGHSWLDNFLASIRNETWIRTVHLQDVAREPPAGRIYLPTASYEEMGEWVLPDRAGFDYHELKNLVDKKYFYLVHGGYFKNFLSKYPEANLMHKRMLYISKNAPDDINIDAKRALWKGQCSCAYWHGIFGGLYLPHLREGIYGNLIQADNANIHEGVTRKDFDTDGTEELLVSTRKLFCIIRPATGAFMEIDDRVRAVNILNYLARRKEKYHRNLPASDESDEVKSIHEVVRSKGKDLVKYLIYDRYERGFGIDHLLELVPSAEEFCLQKDTIGKIGRFTGFETREGQGNGYEIDFKSSDYEKKLTVAKDAAAIVIQYKGSVERLGIEFSLGLFNANLRIDSRYSLHQMQSAECSSSEFAITGDNLAPIKFLADRPFTLLSYPIETISSSEAGFEKNFQGFCLMLIFAGMPRLEVRM